MKRLRVTSTRNFESSTSRLPGRLKGIVAFISFAFAASLAPLVALYTFFVVASHTNNGFFRLVSASAVVLAAILFVIVHSPTIMGYLVARRFKYFREYFLLVRTWIVVAIFVVCAGLKFDRDMVLQYAPLIMLSACLLFWVLLLVAENVKARVYLYLLLLVINIGLMFKQPHLPQRLRLTAAQAENQLPYGVGLGGKRVPLVYYSGDYDNGLELWDGRGWDTHGRPILAPYDSLMDDYIVQQRAVESREALEKAKAEAQAELAKSIDDQKTALERLKNEAEERQATQERAEHEHREAEAKAKAERERKEKEDRDREKRVAEWKASFRTPDTPVEHIKPAIVINPEPMLTIEGYEEAGHPSFFIMDYPPASQDVVKVLLVLNTRISTTESNLNEQIEAEMRSDQSVIHTNQGDIAGYRYRFVGKVTEIRKASESANGRIRFQITGFQDKGTDHISPLISDPIIEYPQSPYRRRSALESFDGTNLDAEIGSGFDFFAYFPRIQYLQ